MDVLDEPRITRHRLTVEQYHRIGEAGVLAPDARVELIEGEVIEVAESSLAYDLRLKSRLYALHGAPA